MNKKVKTRLAVISDIKKLEILQIDMENTIEEDPYPCLLYTSDAADE